MSFDCYGKLVPAIATSWEASQRGLTVWTFHLRDDVDWVDCNGEVEEPSPPPIFWSVWSGAERLQNEANTSMPTHCTSWAEEYYERPRIWARPPLTAPSGYASTQACIEAPDGWRTWFHRKHSAYFLPWPPTPALLPAFSC